MKKIIISLIVFISLLWGGVGGGIHAQQLPGFSQYLQNDFVLNPAIAGTRDYAPAMVSHRSQWLNFSDAPTTQIGSIHGGVNQKIGIGLMLINHETGPTGMMSAQFAYAYRFKANEKIKLSFGLAPMIIQHYLNKSKIVLEEQNDNTFNRISGKTIVADVNAGIYMYSEKYFAGIAVPQLMGNKIRMGDDLFKERLRRHFLVHAGYDYAINEKYVFTPSVLFKIIESGSPSQLDINVKATYNKLVWAGLSYRVCASRDFSNAAVIFAGISKANFSFGYSYDYGFASVWNHSNGTHELFLSYRISFKKAESKPEEKKITE